MITLRRIVQAILELWNKSQSTFAPIVLAPKSAITLRRASYPQEAAQLKTGWLRNWRNWPKIMNNFSTLNAVVIFVTYITIDMLYAYYILCVARKKSLAAANCSAVIYSLLAYGVISYSENVLYIIPLASGAWLGTFLTVKFEHKLNWHTPRPKGRGFLFATLMRMEE